MDREMENIGNAENEKTFHLKIVTPSRVVYDDRVNMFIARTIGGDMGVLYGHESSSALLSEWSLRIFKDGKDGQGRSEELLMVLGGMLTIKNNEAVVVSDIAEYPDKMREYIEQLKAEKEESKVRNQTSDLAVQRMEIAIRQVLVTKEGSAYPVINKGGEQSE